MENWKYFHYFLEISLKKDSNVNELALTMAINCTVETPNYHWDVQPLKWCSTWSIATGQLWQWHVPQSHLHIWLADEQQENWTVGLRVQTESHTSLKNIHHLPQQLLIGLHDEQLQSLGEVNHLCPYSTPWDSQSHPSPQKTHINPPLLYCYLQWSGTSTCAPHCEEDSGSDLN